MDFSDQRTLILNAFNHPTHHHKIIPLHFHTVNATTTSCGDHIVVGCDVTNHEITCVFSGGGCILAIASTELMITTIKSLPLDQAIELLQAFIKMIQTNANPPPNCGDLIVFVNLAKTPARINCVLQPALALVQCLEHFR